MKKTSFAFLSVAFSVFIPSPALAHCPLCTGGAGAAAAIAAFFGVKYGAIAVFMGAFATALGLWLAHKVKKQYIKHQSKILFWVIYLSTLLPLYPFLDGDYVSKFVSVSGEYGSWLNKTYLIDLFWIGAIAGTVIVYFAPRLSQYVTAKRDGKMFKFQGLGITFILLLIAALMLQVWPR